MYEEQLAQIAQQQFNMESTQIAMDNMKNSLATFEAMKTANKALKKQYGKIDIDKIEVIPHNKCELFVNSLTERTF